MLHWKEDTVTVRSESGGSVDIPCEETAVWDPTHLLYLDDAAELSNLHEGALLSLLKRRFECKLDRFAHFSPHPVISSG